MRNHVCSSGGPSSIDRQLFKLPGKTLLTKRLLLVGRLGLLSVHACSPSPLHRSAACTCLEHSRHRQHQLTHPQVFLSPRLRLLVRGLCTLQPVQLLPHALALLPQAGLLLPQALARAQLHVGMCVHVRTRICMCVCVCARGRLGSCQWLLTGKRCYI